MKPKLRLAMFQMMSDAMEMMDGTKSYKDKVPKNNDDSTKNYTTHI